jgi:nucleoside-diphosphate-sugar epimerase
MHRRKVLILGNLGYIGPVLVRQMRQSSEPLTIVGYDLGLFERCFSEQMAEQDARVDIQHFADTRELQEDVMSGVDAVIYLAAISNDPMGRAFSSATHEINNLAAVNVARTARRMGVRSFVFASSCSVYGASGGKPKSEDDALDPLTDYARSKVDAEIGLRELATPEFSITCLRFATACGASPRLRLDLVLNDFVVCASKDKVIRIMSDGTPLRPLIDVQDMANAMIWSMGGERQKGRDFEILNAGSNDWNFSVLEIAETVRDFYGDVAIKINKDAVPDKRSYRVDFSRFKELGPTAYPKRKLRDTIAELDASIGRSELRFDDFRNGSLIRLNSLRRLIERGALDHDVRWIGRG